MGALDEGGLSSPSRSHEAKRLRLPESRDPRPASTVHIPSPNWMRGPGTTQGKLRVEVRVSMSCHTRWASTRSSCGWRNYAEVIPEVGSPGRARHCASATESAPNGRLGAGVRRIGVMRDGNWPSVRHAGVTFTSGQHAARPRLSTAATGPRQCAALRI